MARIGRFHVHGVSIYIFIAFSQRFAWVCHYILWRSFVLSKIMKKVITHAQFALCLSGSMGVPMCVIRLKQQINGNLVTSESE